MAKDPCPKSEDGMHELFPRDGKGLNLYEDTLLGWGADVRCVLCQKHGFVRLDFDNPRWEEEEEDPPIKASPLADRVIETKGEWQQCSPGCHGWLHFDDPFGIERCDECNRFESDGDAVEAHRVECGCNWPDFDYHDAIWAWMQDLTHLKDRAASSEIDALYHSLDCSSGEFFAGIKDFIVLATLAMDKTPMDSLEREYLSKVRDLLKRARDEIESGKLTFAHFNDSSFWVECAKCGKGMAIDDAVRTEGAAYHPACSPEPTHVTH